MSEALAFLNGQIIPESEAKLPVYDAGIVMGATVTENIRTFRKRPFLLERHMERLGCSLRCAHIQLDMSIGELTQTCRALVDHNGALIGPDEELSVIVFVTAGVFPRYVGRTDDELSKGPTVCVHTVPMNFAAMADRMANGFHVVTPSIRHVPPECYNPCIKYRSRMHYYLADIEAGAVDPDAVALLLDLSGNVTETSMANFMMVENGAIVSPTLRNIMPGISRAIVIELADELGIPFVERDFQVTDILNADEAFVTTTPYCIAPATQINKEKIGTGRSGPVFRQLIDAYSGRVGLNIEKQILDAAASAADSRNDST